MSLAIFDLDNTLLGDDSDFLWGQFLVDQKIVDKTYYEQTNAQFYADYKQGTLDIAAFLRFSLKPLADYEPAQLYRWREEFIETVIRPVVLKPALELVEKHRQHGDTLLVITATNRFITEPIVKMYGIEHLLATPPEFKNGRYTGEFVGTPCFQQGKVTLLDAWLTQTQHTLKDSYFYSDSHNDLPLLDKVDYPVAVDPDERLKSVAKSKGWAMISLRGETCPEVDLHR